MIPPSAVPWFFAWLCSACGAPRLIGVQVCDCGERRATEHFYHVQPERPPKL